MGRRMLPKPPEGGHHHQQRSHSLDRSAELHLSSQDDIADDDDDMAAAAAAANALLNASFSGPASLPISTTSSSQSPRGGGDGGGKRKNSESGLSDILVGGGGTTASKFSPDGCSLQVKFKKTLPKFRHTLLSIVGPKKDVILVIFKLTRYTFKLQSSSDGGQPPSSVASASGGVANGQPSPPSSDATRGEVFNSFTICIRSYITKCNKCFLHRI